MVEGSSGHQNPCGNKPIPEKGDIVKVKKCDIPPDPEPGPALTPCQEQIRNEKIKRGVIFCPKPPPVPHPPRPDCLAICIEKVKNMPIPIPKHDPPVKCPVPRIITGSARCDRIRDMYRAKDDLPWPGCPPVPPPPPPQVPSPCDVQKKDEQAERCRQKYAHYYPPTKKH